MGYKKMKYAPVVIPTLNRIEHLQRCITSLQRNPWAKYTPLIISVDYPPSEKYQDGYQKVCSYLKEDITGFASVEIIYQKENLGPYENAEFLRKYVGKHYDRYIFSEDDNEFSPNFIEYTDKGLDRFEMNPDVVAICAIGASGNETENENVVLSQNFAAYGYGVWIEKENIFYRTINRSYFEKKAQDVQYLIRIIKLQETLLFSLQSVVLGRNNVYTLPNGEVPVIDETIKLYLISENKYVVSACTRKVRNWGYDGSGQNCSVNYKYQLNKLDIDQRESFEYRYKDPLKVKPMTGSYSLETACRVGIAFLKINIWKIARKIKYFINTG